MLDYRHLIVAAILWAPLFGCSDEKFRASQKNLEITILEPQSYPATDPDSRWISLGEIPIYSTAYAIFALRNLSLSEITVYDIEITQATPDAWPSPVSFAHFEREELLDPSRGRRDFQSTLPANPDPEKGIVLDGKESALLWIPYAPQSVGIADTFRANIFSDADNEARAPIAVDGTGILLGTPQIEVTYNGISGPQPATQCYTRMEGNTPVVENDGSGNPIYNECMMPTLDFGNVGLGLTGSQQITIRNTAVCTPAANVDPCTVCALELETVALDPSIDPSINDRFSFFNNVATPATLWQTGDGLLPTCAARKNEDIGKATGSVRLLLNFSAPETASDLATTLVVESNDPQIPRILIPITAASREVPVSVCKLRPCDPGNPNAPCSINGELRPLQRIYLDGSDSFDTGTPPLDLVDYQWTITGPAVANSDDFTPQGDGTELFDFFPPIAGEYEVRLLVTNTNAVQSGVTTNSVCRLSVEPAALLHVELLWDHPTNDMDLHMLAQNGPATLLHPTDRICSRPGDCHWRNCLPPESGSPDTRPVWFAADSPGEGANPSLDKDDTNGIGPENIRINTPQPAEYHLYVHYFEDPLSSPTEVTVRIFLEGLLWASVSRILDQRRAIWSVGHILWQEGGGSTYVPYPSDSAGQVGAVNFMGECNDDGYVFPE